MAQRSFNRPEPREGPHVPYKNESGSNPILRGYTLAVVSSMYTPLMFSSEFLSS